VIAFIGSVFSPYYAWARRRGPADPRAFCCLNVVLSGPQADRWAMTERGASALRASPGELVLGPSALAWDGDALTIAIDEVTAPLPRRIRGTVRVHPSGVTGRAFALDAEGVHRWWPIAPRARVEVDLESPGLRWSGTGYLDSNAGSGPLERAFVAWDWSRAPVGPGTAILYEVGRRDGTGRSLALRIDAAGGVEPFEPPPRVALAPTRWWRIARGTRSEPGFQPRVAATLLDAPFYARSVVSARLLGEPVTAMHESLSLDRFRAPWVQAMLPFRVPRRPG
jgi:carotenoid 1,2-hydratase